MKALQFIQPDKKYAQQVKEACLEYHRHQVFTFVLPDFHEADQWISAVIERYEVFTAASDERMIWCIEQGSYKGLGVIRREMKEAQHAAGGQISIAVLHKQWHQGYGKAIMEALLLQAREWNLHEIICTCDQDNRASWHLVESFGAQKINEFTLPGHSSIFYQYRLII